MKQKVEKMHVMSTQNFQSPPTLTYKGTPVFTEITSLILQIILLQIKDMTMRMTTMMMMMIMRRDDVFNRKYLSWTV